jgi:hypothetical protein
LTVHKRRRRRIFHSEISLVTAEKRKGRYFSTYYTFRFVLK